MVIEIILLAVMVIGVAIKWMTTVSMSNRSPRIPTTTLSWITNVEQNRFD